VADPLQHRPRLLRALRIAGLALGVLLLLCSALLLWATHSESGTRSLWSLARGWIPSTISLDDIGGVVAGTLRVHHFRYRDPVLGIDVFVEDATIDAAPLALWSRQLRVQRLVADGVRFEMFTPEAPAPPRSGPARDPWRAPLDMFVDELRLTRAEWRRADAPPLRIERLHFAGSWQGADIEARTLEASGPDGHVSLSLHLAPQSPRLASLRGQFSWRLGEHQWAGVLDAKGADKAVDLAASLESPVKLALTSRLERRDADQWQGHLDVRPFDPHPLISSDAFRTLGVELEGQGNLESLQLRGVLAVDSDRIHFDRLAFTRSEEILVVNALKLRLNEQPAALTGHGTLSLDGSKPASAELQWGELRLPDAWAGANFRSSGKIALTATAQRYAFNGAARLARGQHYSTLTMRVDGSSDALHVREFELTQASGSLSVAGNVDLDAVPRWDLTAQARKLDPSLFSNAWPGALDFDLRSRGEWPDAGPRARFELARLAGRLRARAIEGAADITIGPDLKPAGKLHLKSGGASVDANASAGVQPRVDVTLRVSALDEWHAGLHGALDVVARAEGRWPNTDLDATVRVNELRHADTHLKSARVHLVARNPRAPAGTLDLEAEDAHLAGFQFRTVSAKLAGDVRAHEFHLDARGEPLALALHASGAWEKSAWTGSVDRLSLNVQRVPPLALAEAARLRVARDGFELANTCLTGGDIALCGALQRRRDELEAHYSIRALPLAVIASVAMPESPVALEGMLEGGGDLRRSAEGRLSGRATLSSPAGAFAESRGEDAMRLEYRDFSVDVDLANESAQAQLRAVLPRQGDIAGTITLTASGKETALGGHASLQLRDLAPMGLWIPQLANLRGSGELGAEFAGTLAAPRVAFTVRGNGLDAEVPLLGLHLKDGTVKASLAPAGTFDAQGSISSGDGALRLSGARDAQGGLQLKFAGDKLLAANVPGARVTIAPDLALSGKLDDLLLSGSVKIESAEVHLEKLNFGKASKASGDVVVVDRQQDQAASSLGLRTDVRVILGDQVKLDGFGLDASVAGELRVLEERDQPSRATGEIRVDGTYEAFGRKLTIERGRLQFAGTALDDPQLDILATRKLQDVTAKLRVSGTAQHPKLDVFTDPAMSQTDAMAYLLTGKPASDLHGEDGATVQNAAQSVGSVLGNRLAKKLGGKVGFVDQVGVEQNADLGGSAFTVGKYLSPKLFVSYGVGLFEPGTAVTVRYEFSDRWSLEANDSPEDQHAGVRYRIEK